MVDPRREQHDVVGVHEAGHAQKRPGGLGVARQSAAIPVTEPRRHPGGDQRIATQAGVGHVATVRLGTHPPRKAKGVKRVSGEVGGNGVIKNRAVCGVCDDAIAGVGVVQVGVGDVPLAVVVGVVAR